MDAINAQVKENVSEDDHRLINILILVKLPN